MRGGEIHEPGTYEPEQVLLEDDANTYRFNATFDQDGEYDVEVVLEVLEGDADLTVMGPVLTPDGKKELNPTVRVSPALLIPLCGIPAQYRCPDDHDPILAGLPEISAVNCLPLTIAVLQRISVHHTGVDSVFLSRDILNLAEPGIYIATVHGYGKRNNYRLGIERSYPLRTPSKEEQQALEALYERCCPWEGACWLLESATAAGAKTKAGNGNEEKPEFGNFCHLIDQSCDKDGHITSLRLPAEEMECELPKEVSNLKWLQRLDLEDNYVFGNLSNMFEVLKDLPLESIHMSRNELDGNAACLPTGSVLSDHLTFLDLSHNWLEGELPVCIFDSDKLEIISLAANLLHGEFPHQLPHAPALRHVDFSWQGSSDGQEVFYGAPADFTMWPRLQYLNLAENHMHGPFPALPPTIHSLWLDENKMTGPLPVDLGYMLPNLEVLALDENNFNGKLPATLPRTLRYLNLGLNKFSGEIPWLNWLANPEESQIEEIRLGGNDLTGSLPASVARLPKLWALNITENRLSGGLKDFADALPTGNVIRQFEVAFNELTGPLPIDLSKLSILGGEHHEVHHAGYDKRPAFDVANNNLDGTYPFQIAIDASNEWDGMFFDVSGNRFTCPEHYLGLDDEQMHIKDLLSDEECYDRRGHLVSLGEDQEKQRTQAASKASEALVDRWSGSPLLSGKANMPKFASTFDLSAHTEAAEPERKRGQSP